MKHFARCLVRKVLPTHVERAVSEPEHGGLDRLRDAESRCLTDLQFRRSRRRRDSHVPTRLPNSNLDHRSLAVSAVAV